MAPESLPKKSARGLRQEGSDYRCCIPALAGFVSPQSIAPDGDELFAKDRWRATAFSSKPAATSRLLVGRDSARSRMLSESSRRDMAPRICFALTAPRSVALLNRKADAINRTACSI